MSVNVVSHPDLAALRNVVRDGSTDHEMLRAAVGRIASILGSEIAHQLQSTQVRSFVTPMGESMQGQLAVLPRTVVVTTKDDFQHFGRGLASAVGAIALGSMDFGTDRGIAALNANERSIHMPDIKGHADLVVVAKAIIATGCTAITLTKAAMNKYKTKDLIVVSAFHSREGIRELVDEFPHATIVVAGDADSINAEGLLIPGVGLLDQRLRM